jgi:hypothetical protein
MQAIGECAERIGERGELIDLALGEAQGDRTAQAVEQQADDDYCGTDAEQRPMPTTRSIRHGSAD